MWCWGMCQQQNTISIWKKNVYEGNMVLCEMKYIYTFWWTSTIRYYYMYRYGDDLDTSHNVMHFTRLILRINYDQLTCIMCQSGTRELRNYSNISLLSTTCSSNKGFFMQWRSIQKVLLSMLRRLSCVWNLWELWLMYEKATMVVWKFL